MEPYKVDFEESELQTIETARKHPISNPQWMPYLHGFVLQVTKLKKKELLESVLDPWNRPLREWYTETMNAKDDRGAEVFAPSWNEPCHWFHTCAMENHSTVHNGCHVDAKLDPNFFDGKVKKSRTVAFTTIKGKRVRLLVDEDKLSYRDLPVFHTATKPGKVGVHIRLLGDI